MAVVTEVSTSGSTEHFRRNDAKRHAAADENSQKRPRHVVSRRNSSEVSSPVSLDVLVRGSAGSVAEYEKSERNHSGGIEALFCHECCSLIPATHTRADGRKEMSAIFWFCSDTCESIFQSKLSQTRSSNPTAPQVSVQPRTTDSPLTAGDTMVRREIERVMRVSQTANSTDSEHIVIPDSPISDCDVVIPESPDEDFAAVTESFSPT